MTKRLPWASHRYNEALENSDLLQVEEAADYLGVAVGWLRKHIFHTEWHHCYLTKYGDAARAYFWRKDALDLYAKKHPEDIAAARKRKAAARKRKHDRNA